ncbi:Spectinomycin tetracycline efflux pump [Oligella ureolytica]|uniref:MFS transporter n=1 Tax=Oligella ureolytica TaxID=90244 RepID=A0A378XGV4_9BURK|nr:MFS transporter [Oligella ureolytica]QPT41229.1 MFS transporter [Oligella ureolytica]SUA54181.1 Spectinomycin tetracycline efflux pump [Oligella ureolytica]SUA55075.1 Spectinomycin tetracycline efflux pump [Oligella ureolytica]
MSNVEAQSNAHSAIDQTRKRIIIVILSAIFMSLLSVSIVNVALPSIQSSLHAGYADLQWILAGYTLSFGIFLVGAGRAGDLFGRGALFIAGTFLFTLASIASGLATDPLHLNIARVIQGIGSGFLTPQGVGMIQQYFHGKERGWAFGLFGTTVGVSVALGPVLGGLLINLFGADLGWRLTFLINVPTGILTMTLAWLWFPRPLLAVEKLKQPGWFKALDPIGAIILGLAVLAILFPFVESYRSPVLWVLLPIGLVLVLLFIRWERRFEQKGFSPMVNLDLFSITTYRNGNISMCLYFLGITSIWVLVPIYLQQVLGFSAFESGLLGLPSALMVSFTAVRAGKAVGNYGIKVVIVGLAVSLIGLLFAVLAFYLNAVYNVSIWWLAVALAIFGIGQGATISPIQTLTLSEVPLNYAGSAGAVLQTGQRIGTSVGIAVITAIVFTLQPIYSWMFATMVGFGTIIAMILIALLINLRGWKKSHSTA